MAHRRALRPGVAQGRGDNAVAVLKVLKGTNAGQVIELIGERTVLGRHPNCRVVLDDAAVSRNHAQILESHGSYFIEDLKSRNGTLVNGERTQGRVALSDADQIQVCNVLFSFHLAAPTVEGMAIPIMPRGAQPTADGLGRTASGKTGFEAPETDELEDASSIISTINVSSITHLRLTVRPEVKLRAILEISASLGKTLRVSELLPKILEGFFKIFPQADRGFVLLREPESNKLIIKAMRFRSEEQESGRLVSTTIVKQALTTAQAILTEDAATDKRFNESDSIASLRIHSLMCVPLLGADGEPLGVIQLDTLDLRYRFTSEDLELLASVACQVSLAVENSRLHEDAIKKRDLERELEFATQVQLGFLPTERPRVPGFDFYDFYEAALRVGGDFFDYLTLQDGRLVVALGDVAGKGVAAALLMARLHSMTQLHLLTQPTPARAMNALNRELTSSGLGHRFVTFLFVVLDPAKQQMSVVNAGHLPPLLRTAAGKVAPVAAEASGLPLGIKADTEYEQGEFEIAPGNAVLLYTDGVTEAMNPKNEIYGTARLTALLSRPSKSIAELGESLVDDVENFCEGRAQRDDICLVGFRRSEK